MERIAYNARSLNFCRVFVAIISGIASGVLGLEGIPGFLAFFLTTFLLSVGLYFRVACDPKPFFKKPNDIWTEGISQAAMSYILFWTLFYDVRARCPAAQCHLQACSYCAACPLADCAHLLMQRKPRWIHWATPFVLHWASARISISRMSHVGGRGATINQPRRPRAPRSRRSIAVALRVSRMACRGRRPCLLISAEHDRHFAQAHTRGGTQHRTAPLCSSEAHFSRSFLSPDIVVHSARLGRADTATCPLSLLLSLGCRVVSCSIVARDSGRSRCTLVRFEGSDYDVADVLKQDDVTHPGERSPTVVFRTQEGTECSS